MIIKVMMMMIKAELELCVFMPLHSNKVDFQKNTQTQ